LLAACESVDHPPEAATPPSFRSGDLIQGFGREGVVTHGPSFSTDFPIAVATDSRFMYVAGFDSDPGNAQWRIEKRRLRDGELVSEFGTGGVVVNNPSPYTDQATAIAIDSEFMYVAGIDSKTEWGDAQWRMEKRRLMDGSLVGEVTENPSGGTEGLHCIVVDGDHLYLAGYDRESDWGTARARLEKRDKNTGSLIPGFGENGVLIGEWTGDDDDYYRVVADGSALYVAGYDSGGTGGSWWGARWRIEKRNKIDGSPVREFGIEGVVVEDVGPSSEYINGLLLDSTGLYIAGMDRNTPDGRAEWRIEKRSPVDGSLLREFGNQGVVTEPLSGGDAELISLAIDGEHLYLAGWDSLSGANDQKWRIEKRLLGTGALVSNFGNEGVVRSDTPGPSSVMATALQGEFLYLVGCERAFGGEGTLIPALEWGVWGTQNLEWRIEKRAK